MKYLENLILQERLSGIDERHQDEKQEHKIGFIFTIQYSFITKIKIIKFLINSLNLIQKNIFRNVLSTKMKTDDIGFRVQKIGNNISRILRGKLFHQSGISMI